MSEKQHPGAGDERVETQPPSDLVDLREAIEEIDLRLLEAFRQRMEVSERIAAVKIQQAVPFRDPPRERQVLERIRRMAAELSLDPHQMEHLYRLIMEMSITHQQTHISELSETPLRVAYQGVEGSFSHITAQRRYTGRTSGVMLRGCETFREAADRVRDGTDDLALLPIENSTAGSINETYDLLTEGGLVINAEAITEVVHCLLGVSGSNLEQVRTVISHPQALAQCEQFLSRLPDARAEQAFDTAGAALRVRQQNDPSLAAIASEAAGVALGLEILARGIQNQLSNYTRFVELAREAARCPPDKHCKTSFLLATGHRPGDLGEVLQCFARNRLNLSKLESRPIPGKPWQYRFYIDIEGHAQSEEVRAALQEVTPFTRELRILGTYPMASSPEPDEASGASDDSTAPPND